MTRAARTGLITQMTISRFAAGGAIAAALMTAACTGTPTNNVDCSLVDPVPAGIEAIIRDSVTDQNAIVGAKLKVVKGTYADSATGTSLAQVSLWAGAQAGTYTVTVTKTGYDAWSRPNVDVGQWACGFVPASLTVRLQPQ